MKKLSILYLMGLLFFISACSIDEQFDPNGPSIESVLNNPDLGQLNLLVSGAEARMRNGFDTYVDATGSIARELYKFDADPRNTEELLGKEGEPLDNNTFYLTSPYNTRYIVIKNTNILLEALDNTDIPTAAQKDGYRGFAKTIQAYMLFQVLNMLNDNGIRIDVADPDNLGPFVSRSEAFSRIRAMLDEANNDLSGAEFAFQLSDGFAGFDTPETFAKFNRALAAKVATYAEDYTAALTHLNSSFFDLNGDLTIGPKHIYSLSSGDIFNGLFKTPGQNGDQLIVHNDFITNATSGDARLAKFAQRVDPQSQDGLNGTHETALYESNVSPIDIIRNEELILIFAEASIQTGKFSDAVDAINVIRNAHGIGDYTGAQTEEALIDEMLYQRSYSFWGEGHRMFDLRRYGRLNSNFLPLDRAGDQIFTEFPIPLSENQ